MIGRNFAANVGIAFHTPEEFFRGEAVRPFARTFNPRDYLDDSGGIDANGGDNSSAEAAFLKINPVDMVLFCGSPGSGKSTFYWTHLQPLGYKRVNQDTLKSVRGPSPSHLLRLLNWAPSKTSIG